MKAEISDIYLPGKRTFPSTSTHSSCTTVDKYPPVGDVYTISISICPHLHRNRISSHLYRNRYLHIYIDIDISTSIWISISPHLYRYRYLHIYIDIDIFTSMSISIPPHLYGYRYLHIYRKTRKISHRTPLRRISN